MDQNQINSLDPKLREAYERVMGTASTPNQNPPTASVSTIPQTPTVDNPVVLEENTATSVAPAAEPTVQPEVMTNPTVTPSEPTMENPIKPMSTSTDNGLFNGATPSLAGSDSQMHAYLAQEVAGAKQSLKMIQLLYIGGGIVFFIVYALFWMRFFQVTPSF